jgi:hypothetical protein
MKCGIALIVAAMAMHAHAEIEAAVPRAYFGLHMHSADAGTAWPNVPFGSWRLWDAHVTWKDLEPQPEQFNFTRLDRYVEMARITNTEVLLPLGLTPQWASSRPSEPSAYGPGHAAPPRSIADWKRYVDAVATRYRGRIAAYEIWNEPNIDGFFSGSEAAMVELACVAHEAIKRIDPAASVVSPSATHGLQGVAWLDRYLQAGGSRCLDIVGFHFYTQAHEAPEAMTPLAQEVRATLKRHNLNDAPLWNTEAGWYLRNAHRPLTVPWHALDANTAVAYVGQALLLGWSLGMQRFHWYAWDDGNLGLLELESGEPKAAAQAYAAMARWMTSATHLRCAPLSPAITLCQWQRNGEHLRVIWSRSGSVYFVPPANWRAGSAETLLATRMPLKPGKAVRVGPTPMLIRGDAP